MHIAYVSTLPVSDLKSWSGLAFYISQALRQQGIRLTEIDALKETHGLFYKAKQVYYRFYDQRHRRQYEPAILEGYAAQVQQHLQRVRPDLVFSVGSIPVAHLETDLPIVLWSDATFATALNYYPEYSRLSDETIRNAHRMEQAAIDRADLALYACDWAARSAIDFYGADPAKIKVVPFGANLETGYAEEEVNAFVSQRPMDRCRLLFIGVDWFRKGGDLALLVAEKLNAAGLPTELTVVGCQPVHHKPLPAFVKVEGFINKSTPEGQERMRKLLRESHFFLMPSRAEAYGLVYCEANASALPALARDTGGVPTIIRNGVNGQLFHPDAPTSAYCDWILTHFSDSERYRTLCLSAFHEYRTRLNWDVAGQQVKALMETLP